MKTQVVTKIVNFTLELRDYWINPIIKAKGDLRVVHCKDKDYRNHDHLMEEFMILPYTKLKKGKVVNKQFSRFPNASIQSWLEIAFKWKPIKPVNHDKEWKFKDGKAIQI